MSETTQTQDSSYESNENLIGKAIANETVDQTDRGKYRNNHRIATPVRR